MNSIIFRIGRFLCQKFPFLQPYLNHVYMRYFHSPKFNGWGMTTDREFPWNDKYDGNVFRKASQDIKTNFDLDKGIVGFDSSNIDDLLWRHWNISTAIRYAIKFSDAREFNFVECGVAEGVTAFFALREIFNHPKVGKHFSMHLYDAWSSMEMHELTEDERVHAKWAGYEALTLDKTKRNLSEFVDHTIYHVGHIPQTFNKKPDPPKSIAYLHIDLNSVKATQSALDFFYPLLEHGGVMLFDDYGDMTFGETRDAIDAFFSDKSGILLKFPTGQAMYCHRKTQN